MFSDFLAYSASVSVWGCCGYGGHGGHSGHGGHGKLGGHGKHSGHVGYVGYGGYCGYGGYGGLGGLTFNREILKVKNLMGAPSNPIPLVKRSSEQFLFLKLDIWKALM